MITFPRRSVALASLCLGFTLIVVLAPADEPSISKDNPSDPKSGLRETAILVLRPLNTLVGEWKGVGQPKRSSNVGAWSETAVAAWRFEPKSANLVITLEPGQQYHSAAFTVADDGKTPLLKLGPLTGDPVTLTRSSPPADEKLPDDVWIFESAADHLPLTRCTIRIISDIRLTMLFEEKPAVKSNYRRLSEIGLTRAGARLASGNTGERICIVTGGLGTIKVIFEGKTYYVCCEGCKQAFDADPAGTIKAWRERLKKDEAKAK